MRPYSGLADLDDLTLFAGKHEPDGEMCAMEAVAWIANEPWSDHPRCASPVIASFMRSWNDGCSTNEIRTRWLKPLLVAVAESGGANRALELTRSYLALDWLLREYMPVWMDLVPQLMEHGERLRGSAPALSPETIQMILPVVRNGCDVARVAAWAAARAAAGDAAWDVAGAAAWATAWDAAWNAARSILQPTIEILQASAQALVLRMLEVREG